MNSWKIRAGFASTAIGYPLTCGLKVSAGISDRCTDTSTAKDSACAILVSVAGNGYLENGQGE